MRQKLSVLTVFLLALSGSLMAGHKFTIGEHFRYKIKVFGIHVGYQDMILKGYRTIEGRRLLYAVADTRSLPEIQKTFKYTLHDVMHVWMDPETFLPVLIKKDIHEGNWKNKVTIRIDQKAKTAVLFDKRNKQGKHYTLPGPTLDLLSMIYYIRSRSASPGNTIPVYYFDEKKGVRKTIISVSGGRAIRAGRRTIPTNIYTQQQGHGVRVRLTSDPHRIPLSITVATFQVHGYNIDIVGTIVPIK